MLMNQLATKDATAVVIPQNTKELIRRGVSENTLKAYGWALQKLDDWLPSEDSKRELTDAVLAEYITHLHESGKSPATIAQAVAAVKWQSNNLNINIAGVITERTLAVNIEDVDTTLTVRSSKTDQEGKGEALFIGEPTLDAIEKYCKSGEIESGALFRRIRRGQHITSERLSVVSARRIIKKWAKAAGIEGFISGHSLRVGTAVSLAQSGATLVDMQTAGRWDDPKMPAHYAKAELAERGAVARFFYGK